MTDSTPIAPLAPRAAAAALRPVVLALLVATVFLALTASRAQAATFAATDAATSVHHTSAVLRGHFDPGSDPGVTDCYFEWGPTTSYGNTAPCEEGTSFGDAEDVSASIGDLTPGTTYHFRLHLETTSSGDLTGADRSFTPAPFPTGRPSLGAFGPDGTPGTTFPQLGGTFDGTAMAIDQASDRVYVFSQGASGIFGFDVSAAPAAYTSLPAFAPLPTANGGSVPDLAVDNTALPSAGNLYFASDGWGGGADKVFGFSPSGAPLGGNFPIDPDVTPGNLPPASSVSVCGVAVDSAGHIWVGTGGSEVLLEYSPTGAFLRRIKTTFESGGFTGQRNPCRIELDSNDDLYFTGMNGSLYKEFAPDYDPLDALQIVRPGDSKQEGRYGIGANPADDHLFEVPVTADRIDEWDPSGNLLRVIGAELEGARFEGIAADAGKDFLYTTDRDQIRAFGSPGPVHLPTVTTGPAGRIADTSARLRASVDPEGFAVTECRFEWGTTTSYGNTAPCAALPGSGSGDVAVHADVSGLAPSTTYHFRIRAASAEGTAKGQDVAFTTSAAPPAVKDLETLAATALTNTSARLRGALDPNGVPLNDCHFDWGTTTSYGNTAPCSPDPGAGSGEVAVQANVSGLDPNTTYHFRLQATNGAGTALGADLTLTTRGPPSVETVGSPVRTATTARFDGRLNPERASASYFFQYGTQGPCASNPCTATPSQPAGEGNQILLVAQQVGGLQPGTTYHYRLVADNGNPDGASFGDDLTLTTRASDEPLTHGPYPGPPGSDRAWEQVNAPDTGGNPVSGAQGISDDGERVVYNVAGGTPQSDSGSLFSQLYAQRPPGAHPTVGWQTLPIHPPRAETIGPTWEPPAASDDLSTLFSLNASQAGGGTQLWRMAPGAAAVKLASGAGNLMVSADGSRVLANIGPQLNDLTTGTPELASILPDDSTPTCGTVGGTPFGPATGGPLVRRTYNWVSPDGSLAFFATSGHTCGDPSQLYVRDLLGDSTARVSPAPLSGPGCPAAFLRSTPDAAFFWTQSRLTAEDVAIGACTDTFSLSAGLGGDVYRYDLATEGVGCVTCVVPGVSADVRMGNVEPGRTIAVAEDGSRVYFTAQDQLQPGAPPGAAVYRVDVDTGDLALVAPADAQVGDSPSFDGTALTPDGSVLVFTSLAPGLNQLGGAQNAGTPQYYRYDDRDRSLVCVSCPPDGAAPRSGVPVGLVQGSGFTPAEVSPNMTPLDDQGTFFFATPTPLTTADQNTASPDQPAVGGTDVYEWRDGRLLLVSDGTTSYPSSVVIPRVAAVSPSGRDAFFVAPAALTPDAIDGFTRLYDARVGGGIDFPVPPPPCSLEDCQGPPSAPPVDPDAASGTALGAGNVSGKPPARKCRKGQRKVRRNGRARCVRKRQGAKRRHAGRKSASAQKAGETGNGRGR